MSDIRLPQRPMVQLPAPVDGLDQVRGEASRRRRRKLLAAAGGGAGALAVAAALALSTSGGGLAVLRPEPPAGPGVVQPTPTPSPSLPADLVVDPITRQHPRGGPSVHSGRHTAAAGSGRPAASATSAAAPTPVAGASAAYRVQQPTLSRWQSTFTDAPARQCSGSTYSGPEDSFESSVGWCLEVTASPVSDGVQLHVRLCRDSTGGGTLTFAGSREVDLAVRQGSRTVWDWAALHPGGGGAHQLSEPANGCMNWSVVWPDITTDGAAAGHGSFTFVGTSTANEMKGKPDDSVDFSY